MGELENKYSTRVKIHDFVHNHCRKKIDIYAKRQMHM